MTGAPHFVDIFKEEEMGTDVERCIDTCTFERVSFLLPEGNSTFARGNVVSRGIDDISVQGVRERGRGDASLCRVDNRRASKEFVKR